MAFRKVQTTPDQHNNPQQIERMLPSLSKQEQKEVKSRLKGQPSPSMNSEGSGYGFNQQTLKKIIEMNQNYLTDKVRVTQVRKPSRYVHKLPSKTGNSEYNRKYSSGSKPINVKQSVPQRDQSGSMVKFPDGQVTGYKSSYHIDYPSRQQNNNYNSLNASKVANANARKYERSEAPSFAESSYHRDYHSVIMPPITEMKKPEMQMVQGGKFSGDTTYKQEFRLATGSHEPPLPIVHKDNKIFVSLRNPLNSNYQQAYQKGEERIGVEQSCKPIQKYKPNQNKLKMKTQYSDVYVEQAMNRKKEFECLNNEQLKSYVMNILND